MKQVPKKLAGEAKQKKVRLPRARVKSTALHTHDALYEQIIQSAKDAVIAIDDQQNIVLFNPAAEVIFRCAADGVIGKPLERFIPQRARAVHHQHLTEYGKRRDAVRVMGSDRVVMGLRADGEEFPLDATISQMNLRGTRRYVVVLRDVTERVRLQRELRASLESQKRAEAELRESRDSLRELSAALQSIREEEKTRIARELHDELGQMLTALKMEASAIAGELSPEQRDLVQRAQGMKQLIDQTVASVRRISADMRPVMLDNLGLAPTLEWLTNDVASRAGLVIDLAMPEGDLGASGDAATAIFRIVQEALTNVVRHALASKVKVEIARVGGDVRVRVSDDGCGLSEVAQRKARSFGLLGMRERAYVLGGGFSIRSKPGRGTTVEATIPAFGTVRIVRGRVS
jgi:PAS domain S-box-containing protein